MKKILLTILILVLSLSLTWVAMVRAKGLSPPASFCAKSGSTVYVFTVKPGANVQMRDGVMKFYTVQGAIIADPTINVPLSGSGYMTGNLFRFSYHTTFYVSNPVESNIVYFSPVEVFWDVTANEGSFYVYNYPGGTTVFPLEEVPCASIAKPLAPPQE